MEIESYINVNDYKKIYDASVDPVVSLMYHVICIFAINTSMVNLANKAYALAFILFAVGIASEVMLILTKHRSRNNLKMQLDNMSKNGVVSTKYRFANDCIRVNGISNNQKLIIKYEDIKGTKATKDYYVISAGKTGGLLIFEKNIADSNRLESFIDTKRKEKK